MNKRRGCIKWATVTVVTLVVLTLVVLCPLTFLYSRQLDQARAAFEAPTVYITQPASDLSLPTDSGLLVAATAVGRTPITRVELWAAGELVETQESYVPEGTSAFDASFQLIVPEGANLLYVRAVNSAGIIGQSMPLVIVGEALSPPGEALVEVTLEDGQTLEDVADSHQLDPGALQELNPDLGAEELPPGTSVTVPAWPEGEEGQEAIPPSIGPSVPPPAPGGGSVPVPPVPPLNPIQPLPPPIGPAPLVVVLPPFQPPAAPTNLQGQVENCVVRLRWNDNATNEIRYDVWMAPMGGSPRLIASLQPAGDGPAWVEFPAPQVGGLSFWVEAVSLAGKQPSNIVWVEVDPSCPTAAPNRLQIEVVDMSMGRAYDRAYCYVSFEGTPEVRMPGDDSKFVQVSGGKANIAAWSAADRKFTLPIPGDDSLEITGECWGWAGQRLSDLGSFSGAYARETWDGTRRSLMGEAYEIGVTIQVVGGTGSRVTYRYRDSTMPAPYNLREQMLGAEPNRDLYPESWELWFLNRRLRWDWAGSQQLTGFTIFLNGKEYKSVHGANVRGTTVTLPALYDRRIRWQVAADAGEAQSPLSQELAYDLPKSGAYVQVKFDKIYWTYTHDGWLSGDCATCEAYGYLRLEMAGQMASKSCAHQDHNNDVKCGNTYEFSNLCSSDWIENEDVPNVLILPLDKESKNFTINLWVGVRDWDGGWGPGHTIADYPLDHTFSSLQHAQSVLGCGKQFHEWDSSEAGSSSMYYTLTVYPNTCGQEPTYMGKDWGVHH